MDELCYQFVKSMICFTDNLRFCYLKNNLYWEPDEPPTTVLFAAFGDQIADDFFDTDTKLNQAIFNLIEEAMTCGHRSLGTAVATGLIEALTVRSVAQKELWQCIYSMLGKSSKFHADAWLKN